MDANEGANYVKRRIEELKKYIETKNKFETNQLNQWKEERGIQQDLTIFHKPVTDKISEIKNEKGEKGEKGEIIKSHPIFQIKKELDNLPPPEYSDEYYKKIFQPYYELPSTINPTVQRDTLIINKVKLKILREEKDLFLLENEEKMKLTKNIVEMIKGNHEGNFSLKEIENYLNLIKYVNGNSKATHIQNLQKIYNSLLHNTRVGEGYKLYNPKHLVDQFITLRKYLSAKKAGHNNLDHLIIKILNKIKKQNKIKDKNYKKIIKKYNLNY